MILSTIYRHTETKPQMSTLRGKKEEKEKKEKEKKKEEEKEDRR